MIGLLWAVVASAQEAPAEDFRGYLDQARFFIRKGWYDDAVEQLVLAVNHPDGLVDPEAWYLLATVRYELLDVEGAREAADRAHTYSRDDDQLAQAAGFSAFVHEQLGVLEVQAPYPGLAARLDITLTSMLFDPNLQTFLERSQDRWKKKLVLPVRIGLPVGTYVINGQDVEVTPTGPNVVVIPSGQLGSKGPAVVKLAQAEIGVGVANWLGSDVANLRPSFDLQVGLSVPAGPLRVGGVFDWIPVHYDTFSGPDTNYLGGSLGAKLTWDVPRTVPVLIRPGIGYRFAMVPGIEVACVADGSGYVCGGAADTDLLLYAVGLAHVPFAEITLGVLDSRRTADIGFGVKGVVEQAFGFLPAKGTAVVLEDGTSFEYETDPEHRLWSALGLRALVHLSVAF